MNMAKGKETGVVEITFDQRNYRKHSKKNKDLIKKSLEELGAGRSVLLDKENSLIAGNGVFEQARALGIPVRVVETDGSELIAVKRTDLATKDEKRRKLALADNATSDLSEWDFPLIKTDWTKDVLDNWGVELPDFEDPTETKEAQEDDFDPAEEKIEARCKEGDMWQLGDHRLLCGDSTRTEDVQRLMQGEQADLWLTDPPYNVDYIGKTKDALRIDNDSMSDQEYQAFLFAAFSAAKKVLKAGCPFYVWTAQGHAMADNINALDNVGLFFKQQLIWVKSSFVLGHMDYHGRHEPCLYGWKEGAGHYFVHERNHSTVYSDAEELDIDKMKKEEMRKLLHQIFEEKHPTTVINCEKPPRSKEHPTMKPVKLFGYIIGNSSQRDKIVLDTFGGSGTTIVACEQLDRKARIMEIDPHYCDVIIARWEKLIGQTAIKIN